MLINKKEINETDTKFIETFVSKQKYIDLTAKGEAIRFIRWFSKRFNNEIFLDLGTLHGYSAITMGYGIKNTVISFDTDAEKNNLNYLHIPNIYFVHKSCFEIDECLISKSKVIYLDIDPHDGIKEIDFYNLLLQIGYKGYLVCDDINLNQGMKSFWDSIKQNKLDLSDCAHWSGTGLVAFNDVLEVVDS